MHVRHLLRHQVPLGFLPLGLFHKDFADKSLLEFLLLAVCSQPPVMPEALIPQWFGAHFHDLLVLVGGLRAALGSGRNYLCHNGFDRISLICSLCLTAFVQPSARKNCLIHNGLHTSQQPYCICRRSVRSTQQRKNRLFHNGFAVVRGLRAASYNAQC